MDNISERPLKPLEAEMDLVYEVEGKRITNLFRKHIFSHFESEEGKELQVISIGCGMGYEAGPIVDLFPNSRYLGVDNDKSKITLARAYNKDIHGNNRTAFVEADASEKKVYENHLWDVVLLRNPQLFGEMKRAGFDGIGTVGKIVPIWEKIIDNAIAVLSENGIMFASTVTQQERNMLVKYLESKKNIRVESFGNEWEHASASLGDQFIITVIKST